MRLEAAVGVALLAATALGSAAHNRRSNNVYDAVDLSVQKRALSPSPTVNHLLKRNDVFNAPVWPTVDIPAGFTLAAGVQVTPIPDMPMPSQTGTAVGSSVVAIPTIGMGDPAKWNTEADAKCQLAVAKLNGRASNPSGMVACYNVPFLDPNKGTFEAELRIFNMSMPSEEFVGVTAQSMMVTFEYQAATVQASDGKLPVKRSVLLEERQLVNAGAPAPQATQSVSANQAMGSMWQPIEVSVRKYVGQVNKNAFVPGMNQNEFKTVLIPRITISAINSQNQPVSALLSPTESSFVAGLFTSTTGSLTDPAFLLDKPAEKIAAAAQGLPTPYIVPGLSLNVFPTGLIVTSIWLLLFASAVGLGTLGRIQFRDDYRSEVRRSGDKGVARL